MLAADLLVSVFDDTGGLSVLRYDDTFNPVAGGVATGPAVGMVQGVAVAPDGTFYVSSLFAGGVLHYANDGSLLGMLGAGDATPAPFQAPAALAFGPNGNLYVADLQSAAIFQFDTASQSQQFLPAETLQLTYAPGGFDFEADGDIIVGDLFFQGLNRYDDDNNLTVLVNQGAGFNPAAVLVRPDGDILIGDITLGQDPMAHHQVLLYDVSEGTYSQFINLTTPVGTGSSEGFPPQPSALAFDSNGDLLVGLSPDHNLNGAIQRYNASTGAFIETVISDIGTPTGIAFLPVNGTPAMTVGRHLFYNDSKFDGNTAGAAASDDNAIATDKTALQFTGSTNAPISAFSSYSKGINGIMVDLANAGTITAADFTFKVGTNSNVGSWADAPAPLSVTVREGAGVGGSDRVTIIWANNAIKNTWLQVTVEGNDAQGGYNTNTNLAHSDVFFFGNRVGDTFLNSPSALVSTGAADSLAARNNPSALQPVTNIYDFTKDGTVGAGDELAARNNGGTLTRNLTWLPYIGPMVAASDDDSLAAVASALAVKSVDASSAAPVAVPFAAAAAPASGLIDAAIASLILEPADDISLLVAASEGDDDDALELDLVL